MATTQFHGVGKRKTAVARVYIKPGKGTITVNERGFDDFFPRATSRMIVMQPLQLVNMVDRFDIEVNVHGSGSSAQADATKYGIAFALADFDKALRPTLKKNGFITRDSRVVERKKYGLAGARKRFQFSKR